MQWRMEDKGILALPSWIADCKVPGNNVNANCIFLQQGQEYPGVAGQIQLTGHGGIKWGKWWQDGEGTSKQGGITVTLT